MRRDNAKEAYENANIVLNKFNNYMISNLLHINLYKSVYMHSRPSYNITERLTCARTKQYGQECALSIAEHKLKRVDTVRFLGIIIDEKLNWEPHIEHLVGKVNNYMLLNLLHINLSKSVYMHLRPNYIIQERLTCARIRQYDYENVIKIAEYKLKKVDNVRFLGIMIDEKLSWESHIEHLVSKLNMTIVE